jgi:hypothetical protein
MNIRTRRPTLLNAVLLGRVTDAALAALGAKLAEAFGA